MLIHVYNFVISCVTHFVVKLFANTYGFNIAVRVVITDRFPKFGIARRHDNDPRCLAFGRRHIAYSAAPDRMRLKRRRAHDAI